MSSRLFSEVREKRGLCYYIHSDSDLYHDVGVFGAAAGVDPKRVEEAIQVTVHEFQAAASGEKPITEQDLQNAKDYVAGKMVLSFEDSESVAQYYGMRQLLMGDIDSPEATLEKIKAVTLEQVTEIAQALVKEEELRLAVIGPFKNSEMFEKIVRTTA
jgi:predicted Zn-dependent peptidase